MTPSRRYGESLTSSATATITTRPIDEAAANAGVHPHSCRAYARGAAARIAPSWPTCPVSWVTVGACRTRNHAVTSRRTEVKIIASPAPSTPRESNASGNVVTNANASCPAVIRTSPASSSFFGP